jgi:hypothetical protein
MSRSIEVDWRQEHTTIFVLEDDGSFTFSQSSTSGPELVRVIDIDGPGGVGDNSPDEIDRDLLLDVIAGELA